VAWLHLVGIGSVVVFTSIMEPHPPNDDSDDLPEADDFDPTEVFTMEDFLAEDEIVEELWHAFFVPPDLRTTSMS